MVAESAPVTDHVRSTVPPSPMTFAGAATKLWMTGLAVPPDVLPHAASTRPPTRTHRGMGPPFPEADRSIDPSGVAGEIQFFPETSSTWTIQVVATAAAFTDRRRWAAPTAAAESG